MSKFCTKCGQQLEDNAVFCTNCGKNQNLNTVIEREYTIDTSKNKLMTILYIISCVMALISCFIKTYLSICISLVPLLIVAYLRQKAGYRDLKKELPKEHKLLSYIALLLYFIAIVLMLINFYRLYQ